MPYSDHCRRLHLPASYRVLGVLIGLFAGMLPVQAEFMRIGNVGLTLGLNFGANYATNVDGVTDQIMTTEGTEDFWITYGANLSATAAYFPKISLAASTSLTWEKHFIKDEESPDNEPSINISATTSGSSGAWNYSFNYTREEPLTEEESSQVFIGGRTQAARDRIVTDSLSTTLGWNYKSLTLSGSHNFSRETHREGLEAGNTEWHALSFSSTYQLHPRVNMNYAASWTRDTFPDQDPPPDAPWLRTQSAGLTFLILQKPSLSLSIGAEREEELEDRKGQWDPIYTFTLSDSRNLAPNLTLNGSATYNIEKNPEEDDIAFSYSGTLAHTMPHGWAQSLTANREPAQTFGSSTETDSTTYSYSLTKGDFIFRQIAMSLSLTRNIDRPPNDAPKEVSDNLTFSLSRALPQLFRNFNHSCTYTYTIEDSNLSGRSKNHMGAYTAGLAF